jgi:hypothetical protein
MADDDLTTIAGLQERHRRVLDLRLGVTTFDALGRADPQAILGATSRIKPRPTIDQIRGWQAEARARALEGGAEAPAWERVATFVLSFEQRALEGRRERQLVVQQTELEREPPPTSWPHWDCGDLCGWLRQNLGGEEPAPVPGPREPEAPGAEESATEGEAGVTAGEAGLHVAGVAVVDSTGRVDLVSEGAPGGRAIDCTPPARLEVRVAGGRTGGEVRVALRFRRPGAPGWNPVPPASTRTGGLAVLDLSPVASGRYDARLVAWAPDGSAEPIGLDLGPLSIHSGGT